MFSWIIVTLWLVFLRGSQSDEEDPLQHVAKVAAKERQLTHILRLLEKAAAKERHFELDIKSKREPKSCTHKVLDLKITTQQLRSFVDGRRAALRVANLLNNLFLAVPSEATIPIAYPPHIFYALVRAALEGESELVSIGIAFQRGEFRSTFDFPFVDDDSGHQKHGSQLFAAYSFRKQESVRVRDLAALYNDSYDHAEVEGTQWFTHLTYRHPLRTINASGAWASGRSFAVTRINDGIWFSRPFLDCGASEQWVLAHSLPFFSSTNDDRSAKLSGVVVATFPLSKIDINQCEDSKNILENIVFGGTHKCDSVTTQCVPIPGLGFVRGGYRCICKPTHYRPTSAQQYFNGTDVEEDFQTNGRKSSRFSCVPCPEGCPQCSGSHVCFVQYNAVTRLVPVCIQVASVVICLILSLAVFKMRKCKVIASSLWTMLEVILLGAIIIYASVFLRYMEPTVVLCLLEPWVREMGFALFYGAIVLKLYRTLVDHRTRKAHRYVIRDRDLLRYLSGLVAFMLCYLSAWASLSAQLALEGHSILDKGRISGGLTFSVCRSFWWEYVTEAGELLFVSFGLYLSWQLRGIARDGRDLSEARERCALVASLSLEFVFSLTLYALRHILWLRAHPDHVFIAYFVRTHITVTLSLILILFPKLLCVAGWKRSESSRRTVSTAEGAIELRLCEAIANGELETANLSQMDPEEIRSELRRVYTQLEELRMRTMRKDNPHISKRRGGRKPTHRRFSLQGRKGSKDKHYNRRYYHHHFDGIDDNKTPEESVCSVEGPSVLSLYADGPSTFSDVGTPSILHRNYKMQ